MPYLNLDFDYFDHPKTVKLVGLLGRGSEILPIRLWIYAGKFYSKDGRLSGHSAKEIELLVGWKGNPGKALEALACVGFISKDMDGYIIHDWSSHQGHIWAIRTRNKKVARNRWENIRKAQSLVDTRSVPESTKLVPHTIPSVPSLPTKQLPVSRDRLLGMPYSKEFLDFWESYPRKMKQGHAAAEWEKLSPQGPLLVEIMGALAQHKVYWQQKATDIEFIPHPASWLSARSWKDDLSTPVDPLETNRKASEAYFREVDG